MKIMKISIIEPVGGHGGMDYYDYGLAYGLGENNAIVNYHTCSKTNIRLFKNVTTYDTFRNVWEKKSFLKLINFLIYYLKAIRFEKKQETDIIHLHFFSFPFFNLLILILLRVYSLKVVVTIHDVDSFHNPSNKWIERLSYQLINGIIVHNKSSAAELQKKTFKLPPLYIIPHGNYLPFVKPQSLPDQDQTINLLFFGQIKEVKGLDILLNAFSQVRATDNKYRLIIAGRPWKTELKHYEELIINLNISDAVETHFRYIPDDEIESFYSRSHIVILPYRRIYQSGVLLLTMSYGRTAITSDLPAFQEIIEHGRNGFMFKSEDVNDLSIQILKLTPELIYQATSQAQKTINDKFDWNNIGKQTLEFYKIL